MEGTVSECLQTEGFTVGFGSRVALHKAEGRGGDVDLLSLNPLTLHVSELLKGRPLS